MTTQDVRPLEGIRVLAVTVYLAGPFLGMTLARFGAEVIKIEMPGTGDPIRSIGPFTGPEGNHPDKRSEDDVSMRFLKRSEGVKSVTLNLKDPEGKRLFLELARQSDVLIENLSPGSMQRLGLGYEDVAKVNPGIVYCSISGYGQSGPYKDFPAHDYQVQAMSGIMDVNGETDGPPTRLGIFLGDLSTPLYAAYSILGALRVKEKTGRGQHLDASMMDTLATFVFMEPIEEVLHQGLPVRVGNQARHDPTGLYRLADGDVFIAIATETRWQSLCRAIGLTHLLDDERYKTAAGREAHVAELRAAVQETLKDLACNEAITLIENAGVPIARVRALPEVIDDPHFRARGTLRPMLRAGCDEPVERGIMAGFPVTFSGGPLKALEGGAPLGAHNREILGDLIGLDEAALADLAKRGVI
jgi:crotonobetainyl-CoA:carnitine CoA-transferase CaiB-like acyl-CoA transferase